MILDADHTLRAFFKDFIQSSAARHNFYIGFEMSRFVYLEKVSFGNNSLPLSSFEGSGAFPIHKVRGHVVIDSYANK